MAKTMTNSRKSHVAFLVEVADQLNSRGNNCLAAVKKATSQLPFPAKYAEAKLEEAQTCNDLVEGICCYLDNPNEDAVDFLVKLSADLLHRSTVCYTEAKEKENECRFSSTAVQYCKAKLDESLADLRLARVIGKYLR